MMTPEGMASSAKSPVAMVKLNGINWEDHRMRSTIMRIQWEHEKIYHNISQKVCYLYLHIYIYILLLLYIYTYACFMVIPPSLELHYSGFVNPTME